jgi:hypothetical protein
MNKLAQMFLFVKKLRSIAPVLLAFVCVMFSFTVAASGQEGISAEDVINREIESYQADRIMKLPALSLPLASLFPLDGRVFYNVLVTIICIGILVFLFYLHLSGKRQNATRPKGVMSGKNDIVPQPPPHPSSPSNDKRFERRVAELEMENDKLRRSAQDSKAALEIKNKHISALENGGKC